MPAQQIPLDLGHRAAFAREDFWVSGSNADAIAWLDRWPDWPAPALIVHGPKACGKTHLLHVWRKEAAAQDFDPKGVEQAGRAVTVDDVDGMIGDPAREEALLHLYNLLKETGGHMLVAAAAAPQSWRFVLPDLKSRLLAAPAVAVGSPDDQLMAVVLAKHFSDRQIAVPPEVIAFILPRVERSFAALSALVARIDQKALAEKRAVTVPLVREMLAG